LVLSSTLVPGESTCTPQEIHLSPDDVRLKSQDNAYQEGDIFYRKCTEPSMRSTVGWCPDPHDPEPRVQINLPRLTDIHGIVFQTIVTDCADPTHTYLHHGFLETFDLQFVRAGDKERILVTYGEGLRALSETEAEHEVRMTEPLVTKTLQIIPREKNIYPCFRFKLLGCESDSLCSAGWCLNGGTCAGKDYCLCQHGFFGNRCDNTLNELEQQDYSFQSIVSNVLTTPAATFNVVGDVTLDTSNRRRGHHHGHSCHVHSSHGHHESHNTHSYIEYHHGHGGHSSSYSSHGSSSSSSHNSGHSSEHAMCGLSSHHSGFTTSLGVSLGHNHHGNVHFYSNGGHLQGHAGASLTYNNNHLQFHVSTGTHTWQASHQCTLTPNTQHNIVTSWHPQTGGQLILNNTVVATAPSPKPTGCQSNCFQNVTLKLGAVTVTGTPSGTFNINVSLSNLLMYSLSRLALNNLGVPGPYTPAPPTSPPTTTTPTTTPTPTTPAPTTPTTTPTPTTTVISATPAGLSTNAPTTTTPTPSTTTAQHGPMCFEYTHQSKIGASSIKVRCNYGDQCALFKDKTGYTAKCLSKQLCAAGKRLAGAGQCWECCDSYLCNDHCAASTTQTCQDKSSCATLVSTGYDVCKNTVMAADICKKTCNLCP